MEYINDDLADDSEDETRMERAEGMAERKLAKKRKATQETGGMKRRFPFGGSLRQEEVTSLRAPQLLPTPWAPFQPSGGSGVPSFGDASRGCFQCGQFGHMKRAAPGRCS